MLSFLNLVLLYMYISGLVFWGRLMILLLIDICLQVFEKWFLYFLVLLVMFCIKFLMYMFGILEYFDWIRQGVVLVFMLVFSLGMSLLVLFGNFVVLILMLGCFEFYFLMMLVIFVIFFLLGKWCRYLMVIGLEVVVDCDVVLLGDLDFFEELLQVLSMSVLVMIVVIEVI